MLETALTAGFTSVGMNVFLVGPVPTPAVGMLARSMRADLGVMISASHNPFEDNGIKFFGPDGFKLSDAAEEAIEALLEGEPAPRRARAHRPRHPHRRRPRPLHGVRQDHLPARPAPRRPARSSSTAPTARPTAPRRRCSGSSAPRWSRSASPPTASTSTARSARPTPPPPSPRSRRTGADIGISLDGDADRVMIVDEKGEVADGDQFMALIADRWAARGPAREEHPRRHRDVEPRPRAPPRRRRA